MKNILNSIKEQTNVTKTENGAVAYKSTFNANLDFFNMCGVYENVRFSSPLESKNSNIATMFEEAYLEDRNLALLNLLRMRDFSHKGLGVRSNFKYCLVKLADLSVDDTCLIVSLIPYIGRWDDMFFLLDSSINKEIKDFVLNYITDTLYKDMNHVKNEEFNKLSLLAKWLPNPKSNNEFVNKCAGLIMKKLGFNQKQYRLTKSELSRHLNVVEQKITNGEYSEIDYAKVASKALKRYSKLFKERDPERFEAFIDLVKSGKVEIKSTGIYPYEIISPYVDDVGVNEEDNILIEKRWKSIDRDEIKSNTIVCVDTSGSMECSTNGISALPLKNSISLGILMSEQLTGPFKDKFISFGSQPKLIDLSKCRNIEQKVFKVKREGDYYNTDLVKVYKVLLKASKKVENKEDYIKRLVIVSDMQFDRIMYDIPPYEEAKRMFEEANIPMPEVIFWNVNSCNVAIPVEPHTSGVKLVSGYSSAIVDEIIKSENFDLDMVEFMKFCLEPFKKVYKFIIIKKSQLALFLLC